MNKTVLFLVVFLILGAATYYFTSKEETKSTTGTSWDMDFSIPNTDEIHKVFIADRSGKTATLERKKGYWQFNEKWRARPTAINNLLVALRDVRVSYIAPDAATENMIKTVATQGIKVEVYGKDGQNLKTFYIGGVTNDEQGTFYMMEDAAQPYVVHIPNFVGQLRVRFMVEEEDWRDRAVFYESPETIQSISMRYPRSKSESFKFEKTGEASYTIKPYYATQNVNKRPQRKGIPESYLLQFESLVAEGFENQHRHRDSISQMVPFAILEMKKADGTEKSVRFFPVEVITDPQSGEKIVGRYFADCSWGDFMLIQDLVFNPIFRGYDYFFERDGTRSRMQQ